ncbi:flavodoxin [Paraclostridium bifermentans]|uniref:flavodoxin n=1 Tax=Paraclostridium bifermentans TaxID=1490 RepID=UPI000A177CEC|nr:flavodoxin [Paraclostridium bifermentans]OSB11621.1 flavodoxin [Paraclostridium bifermentans]
MKIIYWSGTGNTETMAKLISGGLSNQGKSTELLRVESVNVDDLKNEDILILGCPSMGDENLEEVDFEPFIESLKGLGAGKKAFLFGSYGWGDGEWMKKWEEQMDSYGFELPLESIIVNEAPEGDDKDLCIKFGENIAKL